MIMQSNGILNSPRKIRLLLLVVTPLLWQSDWATLPWVGSANVKYLGCCFQSRSWEVDKTRCIGKFYGSFNNILNVLRKRRNDMLAVHLIKTYACQCFYTLLWNMGGQTSRHEVCKTFHGTMHFVKFLMPVGETGLSRCSSTVPVYPPPSLCINVEFIFG